MKDFLNKKIIFNVEINELIIAFISFGLYLNFVIQFLVNPIFVDMVHEIMRLVVVTTLSTAYFLLFISFLIEEKEKKQKKLLFQLFLLTILPYGFYAFVIFGPVTGQFYPQ